MAEKTSRRGKTTDADGSNASTAIKSETVRGQYASGTGFEAGNIAPSTKYIDENGKVVDDEPTGIGSVLIAAGDVVREHMVETLKRGSTSPVRYDNEHSPGDASNRDS
jgi:hypothetical protein